MAALTPRECLHLQIDREFACTLGCGELESIARHVLMDLSMMNRWDGWLRRADYAPALDGDSLWSHGHWVGTDSEPCSFDRFVDYYDGTKKRFRVNNVFIQAMAFDEKV